MKAWQGWTPRDRAVVVFLVDGDQVLLVRNKRGLGQGKIGGPGGKLEATETGEEAARREAWEETGLTVGSLVPAARLRFGFVDGYDLEVEAFVASGWTGTLTPCDETEPFWHPLAQLPWSRFWADDALWLPQVLAGHRVDGWFRFDGDAMREAWVEVSARPEPPNNG